MRKVLPIAGVAFALTLLGAPAFAADHPRGNHNGNGNTPFAQQDGDHRLDGRGDRNRNFKVTQPPQRNWQPNVNPQQNWQNNNWKNNNWQNNNDNRWRNNNRFDNFRRNFSAPQRFRVGNYRQPQNFNYRRWSFGERLPFTYLSSNYWLPNAILYGLFSPPQGLIWVRYGSDALLVDRYTGEIVQVRYNMFY